MDKEIINLEYSRFNKLPFEGKFEFLNSDGDVVKNKELLIELSHILRTCVDTIIVPKEKNEEWEKLKDNSKEYEFKNWVFNEYFYVYNRGYSIRTISGEDDLIFINLYYKENVDEFFKYLVKSDVDIYSNCEYSESYLTKQSLLKGLKLK
jgi:regulator of replication initiation timing